MKIAIVCCLHGNEKYGLKIVNRFSTFIPFFIGNLRALLENKRFIDADLNRSFPGKEDGNYEEGRAYELLKNLSSFDYVIDLHSTSNNCPLFGIITKPNKDKIEIAKKMGLKKLVIMSDSFAKGNSLIDFTKCGISLEVGPHDREENIEEAYNCLHSLIEDKNKSEAMEIFEVINIIKKENKNILINNFDRIKKGQIISEDCEGNKQFAEFDFTAVLVGEESYKDVLCLVAKQVNLKVMEDYFYHEKKS